MILRKRAWDVMREDFLRVGEGATLSELMTTLRSRLVDQPEAHLVLVVRPSGRLLGVVTAWDVLKVVEDMVLKDQSVKNVEEIDWDRAFARACDMARGLSVDKLMHRNLPVVRPNDPLLLVLNSLVESKRSWVVVEEGGKAIGVILIGDLYREITRDMVRSFE